MGELNTMQSVQEKVQERIRAAFMDLIPEELWAGLVDAEVKRLTTSVLPSIVREEMEKRVRKMVTDMLDGPDFAPRFQNGSHQPGVVMAEVVKQCAPELVQAMFGGVVQYAVMEMRSKLAQARIY